MTGLYGQSRFCSKPFIANQMLRIIPNLSLVVVSFAMGLGMGSGFAARAELPALASHSATYALSLTRAAQMDGVRAASGKMTYTLIDRCDGYTIESEVNANLGFSNGLSNQIIKRYASWESKDGRKATFRMQTYDNGELKDSYSGSVDLYDDGSGRAVYEGDETKSYDLVAGTMLSVQQLRELLQAAQQSQSLVRQSVMDGAFEEGPYLVTGFIAPQRNLSQAGPDESLRITVSKDAGVLKNTYWPISLAYFPLNRTVEVPDYETNLQLLPNGVIRAMTQDYGGYTLAMDLTTLSGRDGGC